MKRFFLLILSALVFNSVFGQSDSLRMKGSLSVSKSGTYQYKIVVGKHNGNWDGYSVLDEGGANETKSTVAVNFLKQKGAMVFAEKKLISSKSKETSFCFVGGILQLNDKKSEAKGYFIGQDEQKKMCGKGNVKLSIPEQAKMLMTPDGTKDTNMSAIVTSKNSEQYNVKNGEIKLQVWDGGLNDKDSLMIKVNNEMVVEPFQISNEKRTINIKLKKGENTIRIIAINEGSEPPNSAKFILEDESERYPIVSFLKKNEEATIKVNW